MMSEFTKTKMHFALALIGTLFALHPLVEKYPDLGFDYLGVWLKKGTKMAFVLNENTEFHRGPKVPRETEIEPGDHVTVSVGTHAVACLRAVQRAPELTGRSKEGGSMMGFRRGPEEARPLRR